MLSHFPKFFFSFYFFPFLFLLPIQPVYTACLAPRGRRFQILALAWPLEQKLSSQENRDYPRGRGRLDLTSFRPTRGTPLPMAFTTVHTLWEIFILRQTSAGTICQKHAPPPGLLMNGRCENQRPPLPCFFQHWSSRAVIF